MKICKIIVRLPGIFQNKKYGDRGARFAVKVKTGEANRREERKEVTTTRTWPPGLKTRGRS